MKILYANEERIMFDNGKSINFFRELDRHEIYYADFEHLEKAAFKEDFKEPLIFREVPKAGFWFGNKGKMYYIPCYGNDNGESAYIDIYYGNTKVIDDMECKTFQEEKKMKVITLTNEFPFGVCPECGHELNSEDINETETCSFCGLELKEYAYMDEGDTKEILKNDVKLKAISLANAASNYECAKEGTARKEELYEQYLLTKQELFDAIDAL